MKIQLSVTIDKSVYDEMKARKGAVPLSRYIEFQIRRAWALDGDRVDDLTGAARTRDQGLMGGTVFRSNLAGWQKYLELAKVKHIVGDAIDDEGKETSIVRAHVVKAKTLEPFEVHQDPAVKVEGKLKETIHDFSHDSCWGCDPLLMELASLKETPPSDPPSDSASLNARISQDAFDLGYRFLVRVRSLEPEPGFATIGSRIWARSKSAARRERKGRR